MLTNRELLRDKIELKKSQFETRLLQLKAETRETAITERERLEQRLDELKTKLKDGWEQMTESVSAELGRWLDESDSTTNTKSEDA